VIIIIDIYRLELSLASNLSISRYNHISVTNKPNAPYHSMYFGAPLATPSSIKSKSITKFKDAITTTKREKPTLNIDVLVGFITGKPPPPKILIKKLIKYTTPIPAVAAKTPNLKFSVACIIFDLYANKRANKIPKVSVIA